MNGRGSLSVAMGVFFIIIIFYILAWRCTCVYRLIGGGVCEGMKYLFAPFAWLAQGKEWGWEDSIIWRTLREYLLACLSTMKIFPCAMNETPY